MTTFIVFLVLLGIAASIVWLAVRTRDDEGPQHTPPPRHQDDWSTELPSHPYSERPIA
jgi:hypothetical protein